MSLPKKPLWVVESEQRLQNMLDNDIHNILFSKYSYDSANLQVEITALEESKQVGRQSAYKYSISLQKDKVRLLTLELEDLREVESCQGLLEYLGTVDGVFFWIGTVLKLNQVELAERLSELEIAALTHFAILLLMFEAELVLIEEALMLRQTAPFRETWKSMYDIKERKVVEYDGITYWRSDSFTSWLL